MVNNDIRTTLLLFRTATQQPDHIGQRAASRDWQVRVHLQEHDNQQQGCRETEATFLKTFTEPQQWLLL